MKAQLEIGGNARRSPKLLVQVYIPAARGAAPAFKRTVREQAARLRAKRVVVRTERCRVCPRQKGKENDAPHQEGSRRQHVPNQRAQRP